MRASVFMSLLSALSSAQALRLPPPEYSYQRLSKYLTETVSRDQALEVVDYDGSLNVEPRSHKHLRFDFAVHRVTIQDDRHCSTFGYTPPGPPRDLDPVGSGAPEWLYSKPLDPRTYKPYPGTKIINGIRTHVLDEFEAGPAMIRYYLADEYDFPVLIKTREWRYGLFHIKLYHGWISEQIKMLRFAKPPRQVFAEPQNCDANGRSFEDAQSLLDALAQ